MKIPIPYTNVYVIICSIMILFTHSTTYGTYIELISGGVFFERIFGFLFSDKLEDDASFSILHLHVRTYLPYRSYILSMYLIIG